MTYRSIVLSALVVMISTPVWAYQGGITCRNSGDIVQDLLQQRMGALTSEQRKSYQDRLTMARKQCGAISEFATIEFDAMYRELRALPQIAQAPAPTAPDK